MARIIRESGVKGVSLPQARKDDRFEYRLENDQRFLHRIAQARESLRAGRAVELEDTETE
jgi:hypothetical protein